MSVAVGLTVDRHARGDEAWKTRTAACSLPTAPTATRTVVPFEDSAAVERFPSPQLGTSSRVVGREFGPHEDSEETRKR
jgi:hypothetical protein